MTKTREKKIIMVFLSGLVFTQSEHQGEILQRLLLGCNLKIERCLWIGSSGETYLVKDSSRTIETKISPKIWSKR